MRAQANAKMEVSIDRCCYFKGPFRPSESEREKGHRITGKHQRLFSLSLGLNGCQYEQHIEFTLNLPESDDILPSLSVSGNGPFGFRKRTYIYLNILWICEKLNP